MTSISTPNQNLLDACARATAIETMLARARVGGLQYRVAQLEKAYDVAVDKMNAMWDAWNESLLQERLARLRA